MHSQAILLIFLATVVALISCEEKTTQLPLPQNPCASKFKEDPRRINISETCVNSTGLKLEDMPKTEEEFVKTFDDKCYGKCLLTELGMLKDLKFDEQAIKNDILEHVVDKDFQSKITDYTLKCLGDAEKQAGTVTADNICKTSAQLLYCCKKQEMKLEC